MRRRLGLLASAVVTVSIPGALAVLAIVGHEHGIVGTDAMSAAVADESAVGPLPVAPARTVPSVRNAVATVQRTSGGPVTVYSDKAATQEAAAMRLLGQAAVAGQATSYQGVEQTRQADVDGTVTVVSQVWHQGGGLTVIRTSTGATPVVSYDTAGDSSAAGIFGVTSDQVALLGKHYIAVDRGSGASSGLPARIIEVYRFDGSLAARFWLAARTLVPLRREDFDPADELVSDEQFTQVRFGPLTDRPAAATTEAPLSAAASGSGWVAAGSPRTVVASLAGQGVQLPGAELAGLPLYGASWSGTGTGQVTDLEYSDGLSVISLFVQRGTLAASMAGWRPLSLDGYRIYAAGHSVTWAGHDEVYTMIADAAPQTVAEAVAALPASAQPGLVGRLGRGFDRLAHLVDPFT